MSSLKMDFSGTAVTLNFAAFALSVGLLLGTRPLSLLVPECHASVAKSNDKLPGPSLTLSQAIDQDLDGLKSEGLSGLQLSQELIKARQYVNWRTGRMSAGEKTHYLNSCSSTQTTDPFCKRVLLVKSEGDRKTSHRSRLNLGSIGKLLRQHNLKSYFDLSRDPNASWKKLNELSSKDLIETLKVMPEWSTLQWAVSRVLAESTCPSPELAISLAQKAEEYFPDQAIVETSMRLYARGIQCISTTNEQTKIENIVFQKAQFRLAMLHIWKEQWPQAIPLLKVLESSSHSSILPRALYWHQFSLLRMNQKKEAEITSQRLIKERPLSFHALLLMDQLKRKPVTLLQSEEPTIMLRSGLEDIDNDMRLAELLRRVDAPGYASEIVNSIIGKLDERPNVPAPFQLYLAVLKYKEKDFQKSFSLVAGLIRDDQKLLSPSILRLLYPQPYFEIVQRYSQSIDPFLITSLMRQESSFNARARSHAGARGLMQLMPKTARLFERGSPKGLENPETNVRVGVRYFNSLLQRFSYRVELALAAYNAGELKVEAWQKRYPNAPESLFLELIPYTETREYVSIIVRNYYWYRWLNSKTIATNAKKLERKPAHVLAFTLESLSSQYAE